LIKHFISLFNNTKTQPLDDTPPAGPCLGFSLAEKLFLISAFISPFHLKRPKSARPQYTSGSFILMREFNRSIYWQCNNKSQAFFEKFLKCFGISNTPPGMG